MKMEEEEEYFVVEKILDVRADQQGTLVFHIKWEGFGDEDNTWEPLDNLDPLLVKDYFESRNVTVEDAKAAAKIKKEGKGENKRKGEKVEKVDKGEKVEREEKVEKGEKVGKIERNGAVAKVSVAPTATKKEPREEKEREKEKEMKTEKEKGKEKEKEEVRESKRIREGAVVREEKRRKVEKEEEGKRESKKGREVDGVNKRTLSSNANDSDGDSVGGDRGTERARKRRKETAVAPPDRRKGIRGGADDYAVDSPAPRVRTSSGKGVAPPPTKDKGKKGADIPPPSTGSKKSRKEKPPQCDHCLEIESVDYLPQMNFCNYCRGYVHESCDAGETLTEHGKKLWRCSTCIANTTSPQKILTHRPVEGDPSARDVDGHPIIEYCVKFMYRSYRQRKWVKSTWLKRISSGLVNKYDRFVKDTHGEFPARGRPEAEVVRPEWLRVEKILGYMDDDPKTHGGKLERGKRVGSSKARQYLIKYEGLDYDELGLDTLQDTPDCKRALKEFEEREARKARDPPHRPGQKYVSLQEKPSYIHGKLQPHQLVGLNWLMQMRHRNTSCVLADDMGLGKTAEVISYIGSLYLDQTGFGVGVDATTQPVLVIVSKQSAPHWSREFKKWCPDLNVVSFYGSFDARTIAWSYEFDHFQREDDEAMGPLRFHVCVTTFEVMQVTATAAALEQIEWLQMIVEEERVQGGTGKAYRFLTERYRAGHRLLVTCSSPATVNNEQLSNYALLLGDPDQLDLGDEAKVAAAREDLVGRTLKRTTSEVLPMPNVKRMTVMVGMADVQCQGYTDVIKSGHFNDTLMGTRSTATRVSLIKLAQSLEAFCNHPHSSVSTFGPPLRNVDNLSGSKLAEALLLDSCKLRALDQLLSQTHKHSQRVLLLCKSESMVDVLRQFLAARKYSNYSLAPNITPEERDYWANRFNNSTEMVLLMCTKSAGHGCSVRAADVIILYDISYDPEDDSKAIACTLSSRMFHLGFDAVVSIYRLVTRATLEHAVLHYHVTGQPVTNVELLDASRVGAVEISQRVMKMKQEGEEKSEENGIRIEGKDNTAEAARAAVQEAQNRNGDQSLILPESEFALATENREFWPTVLSMLGIDTLYHFKRPKTAHASDSSETDSEEEERPPKQTSRGNASAPPVKRQRRFKCTDCERIFDMAKAVKSHYHRTHGKWPPGTEPPEVDADTVDDTATEKPHSSPTPKTSPSKLSVPVANSAKHIESPSKTLQKSPTPTHTSIKSPLPLPQKPTQQPTLHDKPTTTPSPKVEKVSPPSLTPKKTQAPPPPEQQQQQKDVSPKPTATETKSLVPPTPPITQKRESPKKSQHAHGTAQGANLQPNASPTPTPKTTLSPQQHKEPQPQLQPPTPKKLPVPILPRPAPSPKKEPQPPPPSNVQAGASTLVVVGVNPPDLEASYRSKIARVQEYMRGERGEERGTFMGRWQQQLNSTGASIPVVRGRPIDMYHVYLLLTALRSVKEPSSRAEIKELFQRVGQELTADEGEVPPTHLLLQLNKAAGLLEFSFADCNFRP